MYNRIILMGRIANDLELKTTLSGISMLTFRIAVDRRYQTKNEERKSDFFNVVAWRYEAEFISRFFAKGRMILIEGELQNRPYTDKNGNTAYITEVIADRACFTGEKVNGGGQSSYQTYPATHPAEASHPPTTAIIQGSPADLTSEDVDDYPF